MAEKNMDKSSSLKNLKEETSPTGGKPPKKLNKNASQRAENFSPMNSAEQRDGTKDGRSNESSIKRAQRSKRGSDAAESNSPSRRPGRSMAENSGLGTGRQATKVSEKLFCVEGLSAVDPSRIRLTLISLQLQVANRQKELVSKGLVSGDFKGLATDYPSFELLWFDIESKTRHLIQELIDPVVDRLVDHKDTINQLKQDQQKTDDKVENLKETIFQTNGKLDIFEQINMKLANLEAERKILEDKVDYENKTIKNRMEVIDQNFEIQTKVFKNLQSHTDDVMAELSKLKETYQKQCDLFVSEVDNCNKLIMDHTERLTDYCQRLEKTTIDHKGIMDNHTSQIQELYSRMKSAEQHIMDLEKETTRLEADKTDKVLFYKTKKKLDLKDLEQDIKLFKNINHCITLDNYLEKYLPIRTQSLINETLRSVLGGKERRRLELYDNEKNSLLY